LFFSIENAKRIPVGKDRRPNFKTALIERLFEFAEEDLPCQKLVVLHIPGLLKTSHTINSIT